MTMLTPVILHIDTGRTFRGGQNQVLLTAQYLKQHGVRQFVATPASKSDNENESLLNRLEAIPTVPLSKHSLCRKLFLGRLTDAIRKESVNIIHAHDSEAHTIGLRLKRKFRSLKLVVTRRVIFPPSGQASIKHKYMAGENGVDRYIAISKAVAETLHEIGVDSKTVEVIPSAINLQKIENCAPSDRLEKYRAEYDYLIAAVGALTSEKDFATAISAFAEASQSLPKTALLIFGDGTLRNELQSQIDSLACKNIFLMGHQTRLVSDLKKCHLFFLTSRSEGLNSAAIEAAACGLPLVVSDVGGLPEIAEQSYNGLLCPAGDVSGFASALIEILSDVSLHRKMGENSVSKAAQFDILISGKKILDLYNRLLEGTQ